MFAPRDSRLRLQKPGARHGPGDVDDDVDGDFKHVGFCFPVEVLCSSSPLISIRMMRFLH